MVFISQVFECFKRKRVLLVNESRSRCFLCKDTISEPGLYLAERKLTLTKWGPVREITVVDAT